jgi:hypothetical protein
MNIRDENIFIMNEYNKKIVKFEEFITDYNNCITNAKPENGYQIAPPAAAAPAHC